MRIRKTLQPQQDGAKNPLAHYGDQFVCVRYRYDDKRQRRFNTMELIVEEEERSVPKPSPQNVVALGLQDRIIDTKGL